MMYNSLKDNVAIQNKPQKYENFILKKRLRQTSSPHTVETTDVQSDLHEANEACDASAARYILHSDIGALMSCACALLQGVVPPRDITDH